MTIVTVDDQKNSTANIERMGKWERGEREGKAQTTTTTKLKWYTKNVQQIFCNIEKYLLCVDSVVNGAAETFEVP